MKKEVTSTDSLSAAKTIGEIVMYQPEGEMRLEVRVDNETVWLTQAQMAKLFKRERSVIAKHIKNVFKEGELDSKVVCANFAHTTPHGAIKGKMQISEVVLYNLDVIISVGYRVKSIAGTRFRQWANQVLKDYMLKGYAVNQRKIMTDLQIVDRLHEQRQLIENQGAEISDVRKSVAEQDSRLSAVEQRIDFFVNAAQAPTSGILVTGDSI